MGFARFCPAMWPKNGILNQYLNPGPIILDLRLIAHVFSLFCFFVSLNTWGAKPALNSASNLTPKWSQKPYCSQINVDNNDSIFSRTDKIAPQHFPSMGQSIKDFFFEDDLARELGNEYSKIENDYESKKRFDLFTLEDQKAMYNRKSELTSQALNRMQEFHKNRKLDKLQQSAQRAINRNEPILKAIEKPAALAAGVIILTQGRPLVIPLYKEYRLISKTTAKPKGEMLDWIQPGKKEWEFGGSWELQTPWISGSFTPNPNGDQELYSVGTSKTIPWINVASGVGYGGSSTRLTGNLSKQLTETISCKYEQALPLNRNNPRAGADTKEIKIEYKKSF